jgi:hypothetical protein
MMHHFDRHLIQPNVWCVVDARALAALAEFVEACDSTHDEKVSRLLAQPDPSSLLRRHRALRRRRDA